MADLTLVINLGSSSLKAALYGPGDVPGPESLGPTRLWQDGCNLPSRSNGLDTTLDQWLAPALAQHRPQIARIGHRVVHGGEHFTAPTRITTTVEADLKAVSSLAPLHNPPALRGIAWGRQWAPGAAQWACFDTAFHHTLPKAARTYALPQALRDQGLRRFGFHGLNHQHVSTVVSRQWQKQGRHPQTLRLISAHLGAGASLAAVKGGVCIDTTMGYTPLEGLVMATRSGSVDPGVLLELMRQGLSHADLSEHLERQGGLKGLSGISGDMRMLRDQAQQGHEGAQLAIDVFRHRLVQAIGSMAASLGGADVLALTGGIGEHDGALHQELHQALAWMPALQITVVPADEEGMIARLIS